MPSLHRVLLLLVPALALVAEEVAAPAVAAPAPAAVAPATTAPAAAVAPAPVAATPAPAKPAGPEGLTSLDLRLTIGGGGGITHVRDRDLQATSDYEDGQGGNIAIHLIYLHARPGGIGFAVGGGLFAHSHSGKPDGVSNRDATLDAVGLDAYGAFVMRPTRNWHFELPALVLSGGRAEVQTDGLEDSDSGVYGQVAVQVGAYYTFDFGLQFGLDLGAAGFSARVDRDVGPGISHDFVYAGGGGFLNFNIGFRF